MSDGAKAETSDGLDVMDETINGTSKTTSALGLNETVSAGYRSGSRRPIPVSLLPPDLPQSESTGMPLLGADDRAAMQAVVDALGACSVEPVDPPLHSMTVQLLPHQQLALGWMLAREGASGSIAMSPDGGILADDQGLGKTVTTIALLVSNKSLCGQTSKRDLRMLSAASACDGPGKFPGLDPEESGKPFQSCDCMPRAGSLVVAPTSLLTQWESEIASKIDPQQNMNVLLYHGKRKDHVLTSATLAAYSVVITSYTMLANECFSISPIKGNNSGKVIDLLSDDDKADRAEEVGKKRKRPHSGDGLLFQVIWQRVILDEAQVIKNTRTKVAHATWRLHAQHRWLLSGTPIQNSVSDLFSYFRFLRWHPFDKQATFKQHIADVVKATPARGYKKLQGILQGVLLRRTKGGTIGGAPLLEMPRCTETLERIALDPAERALYDEIRAEAQRVLHGLKHGPAGGARGASGDAYFHALAQLMRLRQACCHPALVKSSATSAAARATAEELQAARALRPSVRMALLTALVNCAASSRCAHCGDIPDDPVISTCSHIMCRVCAVAEQEAAVAERTACPACGLLLRRVDFHPAAALRDTHRGKLPANLRLLQPQDGSAQPSSRRSSKINTLLKVLAHAVRNEGRASESAVAGPSVEPAVTERPQPQAGEAQSRSASSGEGPGAAGGEQLPPRASGGSLMIARRSKSSAFLRGMVRRPATPGLTAASTATGATSAIADKVIVFSQWTGMLDLVEVALREEQYGYRRVDGGMSLAQRAEQISDFQRRHDVAVLLASLRAASLGLNLVAANHVVLLDLWWNPAVEDQAIDRTHRIGQTKAVHVTRIAVCDTVEDRILQLQARKREVIDAAFGGVSGGEGSQLSPDDLLFLFS